MKLTTIHKRWVKLTSTLVLIFFFIYNVKAQQDVMYTKYMFNTLVYNPAYTGSKEYMSISLLHRTQWLGVQGAPHSQSFSVHTPVKKFDRIGVGLNVVNTKIGASNVVSTNLSYAYRIRLGEKAGTLAVGMQGGITNWKTNMREIEIYTEADEAFNDDFPSYWLPNFGFGLYYYSKYAFMGISTPNLLEYDLRQVDVSTTKNARTTRHYYLTAGGAIPLNGDDLILKPMVLVKSAGLLSRFKNVDDPYRNYGAPTEFSTDLSLFIRETLWLGASFRSSVEFFTGDSSYDSVDLWMAYYMQNGLHIGVAYDYTLTELQNPSKASFEVMLGFDFKFDKSETYHPRYF